MTALDDGLLERAREAGARLEEAEREAQQARAEYHTMVRRLHLGGASLREVAGALGLSHQRVQQIVQSAGGTWWQRVWRTRTPRRDAVCTFCERPPSEVAKLIAGPNVYICDACIERSEHALAGRAATGAGAVRPAGAAARCSFCGKRRGPQRRVVAGEQARICSECLGIAREFAEGRR
jgi:hypothetical protein